MLFFVNKLWFLLRVPMDAHAENVTSVKCAYLCWMKKKKKQREKTVWVYKCNMEQETKTGWKADRCCLKLQAPFSLCGCGFQCSFTSLWPHLSQHPSVILSFFLPTPPPLSLSAHLLALRARRMRVCVKGMIFWCPPCVWVLCLSTFSGWPLCLQPSYCSPTHSIRNQACVGA